jgi:cyclopropane-fatty-acyl-phospholipid synthase
MALIRGKIGQLFLGEGESLMGISSFLTSVFDGELPFRLETFDGEVAGTADAPLTIKILRREALTRLLTRPDELGLARAYVAGDVDVEGPLDSLFSIKMPPARRVLRPGALRSLLDDVGLSVLRPLPAPAIEARPRGMLHSRARDRQAVSHHYDVSNRFYEIVLGPSMTYSCAVFESAEDSLEEAQLRKVDLIARKLDLVSGMRLLDIGCGWGTMAIHAAQRFGASVVGITLSAPQQRYATERARAAGVEGLVQFRLQDFRDVDDGPFDAVSSIGMFEHVGRRSMEGYTGKVFRLLRPGGRFLNHAIGRPGNTDEAPARSGARQLSRRMAIAAGFRGPSKIGSPFMERYVFPDGELHEVGVVVSMFQEHGFEVRHMEGLREHYVLTLRQWVANLERGLDEAVGEVGAQRARAWRLYMALSAVGFERHHLEVHQVLCVRPEAGRSQMPLRPNFEPVGAEGSSSLV